VLSVLAVALALPRALPFLWVWFGTCKFYDGSCPSYALAHGRDPWALACLMMLFACIVPAVLARIEVANRQRIALSGVLFEQDQEESAGYARTVGFVLIVGVVLVSGTPRMLPTAVDPLWPSLMAGVLGLAGGAFFLAQLWDQLGRLGQLTLRLSRCIDVVRSGRPELQDWPRPQLLREAPASPFNLRMRPSDVRALRRLDAATWRAQTKSLAEGCWPATLDQSGFQRWQENLVAQVKLAMLALRSCAWAAMLGPMMILLAMGFYPPVFERTQKSAAVFMVLLSFVVTVHAVLRLEKDPLLGPMFTLHGDRLTFGSALSALWPKLVALGVVLAPLVLPDMWSWLYGIVKSINTLR
jgi:hypothetical protein